ncbi:DUF1707 domain-containing protein [Actinomadura sp. NBRC 104425]|uniref:DUF1707 SHOCT-like domain-containing protein n=1 Tax=Actinomadura sp. NBRC 104425 TaxID=3032204 RepID=UPI00255289C6|nr:DUF1707 domain-containing protein [Actinomadura sp. NBRC 104425]
MPSADIDRLRIGDTERDAVAVALHDHFAAGRLTREELDERLDAVLAAKTRADLAAVVHDLPEPNGLPDPPAPRPGLAPAWGPGWGQGWGPAWAAHPMWAAHPALAHHRRLRHGHRHPFHGHRHHPAHGHRPHFAFPLLLAVFLVTTFTAGVQAGLLAVLQLALLVWVVRAVVLTVRWRRTRRTGENP